MASTTSHSASKTATDRTQTKRCDLCDGTDFELVSTLDRRAEPLETGVCRNCGLVCHLEIPTEDELTEYYQNEYRQDYHGESTPSARRVMRAWNNGRRIYEQVSPYIEPGSKVFEVGAGIGCTVKQFELHGYDATGIEPHEGFHGFSKKHLRTRVEKGSLFELPDRRRFDLVLLIHVIEHFRSPRQALEKIHQLLYTTGAFYVECPNLTAPLSKYSQLFHFAHIHNFTPSSLIMLAERCGFGVEQVFSAPDDPNLQILFTRMETGHLEVDANNFDKVLDSLDYYHGWRYYLRWNYLTRRVKKIRSYLIEHMFAKRQLEEILDECAHSASETTSPRRGASASGRTRRVDRGSLLVVGQSSRRSSWENATTHR